MGECTTLKEKCKGYAYGNGMCTLCNTTQPSYDATHNSSAYFKLAYTCAVTTYSQKSFKGKFATYVGDVSVQGNGGEHDHSNYDNQAFTQYGMDNDETNSIEVTGDKCVVAVFEHVNWGGSSKTYTTGKHTLGARWTNRVSSLKVRKLGCKTGKNEPVGTEDILLKCWASGTRASGYQCSNPAYANYECPVSCGTCSQDQATGVEPQKCYPGHTYFKECTSWGDPHYKGFSGRNYDHQGWGLYKLGSSKVLDGSGKAKFEAQVYQCGSTNRWGQRSRWSANKAFALRIDGDIITITHNMVKKNGDIIASSTNFTSGDNCFSIRATGGLFGWMSMEMDAEIINTNEGVCGNSGAEWTREVIAEDSLFTNEELYQLCTSCGRTDCVRVTSNPTSNPTPVPTHNPTNVPTPAPSNAPTSVPTSTPTQYPTSDLISTLVDGCEANSITFTAAQTCCASVENNSAVFAGCIYYFCATGGDATACQAALDGLQSEKAWWWTEQLKVRPTFELLLPDEETLLLAYENVVNVMSQQCFPDETMNEAFHMGRMRLVDSESYQTENPNYKFWDGREKPENVGYPIYLLVWFDESQRGTRENCSLMTDSSVMQRPTSFIPAVVALVLAAWIKSD